MRADSSPAQVVKAGDLPVVFSFLDAVTPYEVDCMECGVVMSPGRLPASHGCCPECKPALRARMGMKPEGGR